MSRSNRSAWVLIIVGSVLLAHNFDLIEWRWLRLWWPALLILLGVWTLLSSQPFDNERSRYLGHPPAGGERASGAAADPDRPPAS